LQAKWSWCTKDSPEVIDETIQQSLSETSSELEFINGRTVKDDLNCLKVNYESGVLTSSCDASQVYLSCESVEKYPSDLLVKLSIFKSICPLIHKIKLCSPIQNAVPSALLKRAKGMLVYSFFPNLVPWLDFFSQQSLFLLNEKEEYELSGKI
jgi:hypothetical protein